MGWGDGIDGMRELGLCFVACRSAKCVVCTWLSVEWKGGLIGGWFCGDGNVGLEVEIGNLRLTINMLK